MRRIQSWLPQGTDGAVAVPDNPLPSVRRRNHLLILATALVWLLSLIGFAWLSGRPITALVVSLIPVASLWLAAQRPDVAVAVLLALTPLEGASALAPTVSWLTAPKLVLVGITLGWLTRRLTGREKASIPRQLLWLVAFLLVAFVSAALAGIGAKSAIALAALIYHVLLVVIVVDVVRTQDGALLVLRGVVLGSIAVISFALLDLAVGRSFLGTAAERIYGSGLTGQFGLWRVTSTFTDANALGRYLAWVAPLTLGLMISETRSKVRRGITALFAVQVVVILITLSRGAALALIVGVGALLLADRGRTQRAWSSVVSFFRSRSRGVRIGIIAGLAAFAGLLLVGMSDRFLGVGNDPRWAIARAATSLITSHPLLGVGFGNVEAAMANYLRTQTSTHNLYLEIAASVGVVGFALWVGFVASAIRSAWRAYRTTASVLVLAAVASVAGMLVMGLTLHGISADEPWIAVGLMMAIATAVSGKEYRLRVNGRRLLKTRRTTRYDSPMTWLAYAIPVLCAIAVVSGGALSARRAAATDTTAAVPALRPEDVESTSPNVPALHVQDSRRLGVYFYDLNDGTSARSLSVRERQRLEATWTVPGTATGGASAIAVATTGLHDYNRWRYTRDKRFLVSSRRAADWLIDHQAADGSWRYKRGFFDLKRGWASSIVQSYAISLLSRQYQETGQAEYRDAAMRAYEFCLIPVSKGGVASEFEDGGPVLEGYAGSKTAEHSLTGAALGPLGLRDLYVATGDEQVRSYYTELSQSLAKNLSLYDVDEWARYSLGTLRGASSDSMLRLQIAQLRALAGVSGDERFGRFATRWHTSLKQWLKEKAREDSAKKAGSTSSGRN